MRRDPVYCRADTPVRDALERMSREGVRTIAVVDDARRPVGVFTLIDLMERVVLPGVPLSTPVADVMTRGPVLVDELSTAQEALALMASRASTSCWSMRGGELAGIVTERDLFGLQRVTMRNVTQSIRLARDVPALRRCVEDIEALTRQPPRAGRGGRAAHAHDHRAQRRADAAPVRIAAAAVPGGRATLQWCWLAVGSEGRREQTVATDQDNAIVFRCAQADVAHARERLLEFARAANAGAGASSAFRSAPATSWRATRTAA